MIVKMLEDYELVHRSFKDGEGKVKHKKVMLRAGEEVDLIATLAVKLFQKGVAIEIPLFSEKRPVLTVGSETIAAIEEAEREKEAKEKTVQVKVKK